MTNNDASAGGPDAHINFDAPATFRKWPSFKNQRRTEGTERVHDVDGLARRRIHEVKGFHDLAAVPGGGSGDRQA